MIFNNVYNNLYELRDFFNTVFDTSRYDTKENADPYCNIYDKDDTIFVSINLPGVNSEDLNVELNDNNLIIKGIRKQKQLENVKYLRQEREYGNFSKVIHIKVAVEKDNISASYRDGVLNIELKKSPEEKPRKININ